MARDLYIALECAFLVADTLFHSNSPSGLLAAAQHLLITFTSNFPGRGEGGDILKEEEESLSTLSLVLKGQSLVKLKSHFNFLSFSIFSPAFAPV